MRFAMMCNAPCRSEHGNYTCVIVEQPIVVESTTIHRKSGGLFVVFVEPFRRQQTTSKKRLTILGIVSEVRASGPSQILVPIAHDSEFPIEQRSDLLRPFAK